MSDTTNWTCDKCGGSCSSRGCIACLTKERDLALAFMRRIHMCADLGPDGNSYLIITEREMDLLVAASEANPADAQKLLDAYRTDAVRFAKVESERNAILGRYADMMRERDALRALLVEAQPLIPVHKLYVINYETDSIKVPDEKCLRHRIDAFLIPPPSTTPDAKETK